MFINFNLWGDDSECSNGFYLWVDCDFFHCDPDLIGLVGVCVIVLAKKDLHFARRYPVSF